jgi:hypothetical protein
MHVDESLGSGALVKIIDVLSDQQEVTSPATLKLGKGEVRGVGLNRRELGAAVVIEPVHQLPISAERFGSGDVLNPMPFP